jgi:hypothetical protein
VLKAPHLAPLTPFAGRGGPAEQEGEGTMENLPMTSRVKLSLSERFALTGGHKFGAAGGYERIIGRAYFAAD